MTAIEKDFHPSGNFSHKELLRECTVSEHMNKIYESLATIISVVSNQSYCWDNDSVHYSLFQPVRHSPNLNFREQQFMKLYTLFDNRKGWMDVITEILTHPGVAFHDIMD